MKRRAKGWWGRCLYKMLSWEPYFFPVLRSERCCSLHCKARNECVEYNVGSFSKDRTGFAAVTNKSSHLSVLIHLRLFPTQAEVWCCLLPSYRSAVWNTRPSGRRARRWKCLALNYLGPEGAHGSPVHFTGHVASIQLQESLENIGAHGYLVSRTNS